jgi:HK97 gp10 family phage protein
MNDVKLGDIQIDGLRDLEIRLLAYTDKFAKNVLAGAMKEGAKVIQKRAREYAPVSLAPHLLKSYASATFKKFTSDKMAVWILPGNLRKMIRVKVDNSGSRGYKISYEVYVKNKDAWYWKFLEFSTSKMPAANGGKGIVRPAFEDVKEFAVQAIKEYIEARLENEGTSN